MIIKNKHINSLVQFLSGNIPSDKARARANFFESIKEDITAVNEGRVALLESFSEKDAEGKAIIENGNYKILVGKEAECKEALAEFMNKEVDLSSAHGLLVMKKMLVDLNVPMSVEDGRFYSEIMDAVESKAPVSKKK